jgi:hypothetical protein
MVWSANSCGCAYTSYRTTSGCLADGTHARTKPQDTEPEG